MMRTMSFENCTGNEVIYKCVLGITYMIKYNSIYGIRQYQDRKSTIKGLRISQDVNSSFQLPARKDLQSSKNCEYLSIHYV